MYYLVSSISIVLEFAESGSVGLGIGTTALSGFIPILYRSYRKRYVSKIVVFNNSGKETRPNSVCIYTYSFFGGHQNASIASFRDFRASPFKEKSNIWYVEVRGRKALFWIDPSRSLYDKELVSTMTKGAQYVMALISSRSHPKAQRLELTQHKHKRK
eukprot:CAMPEP_0182441234 /NCGR_PEP_ID=MMETSP1172-20130603/184_1 /TAXON_ID=708627 /ORGANISM="Timspurckia oligopyrenoides, Strain CCMP3278" /LENGTH=157 /DNA_ID=CAMNT_0024635409 /DNA_START=485 /DNA_END=958 /DNA_ORIENTATION=-